MGCSQGTIANWVKEAHFLNEISGLKSQVAHANEYTVGLATQLKLVQYHHQKRLNLSIESASNTLHFDFLDRSAALLIIDLPAAIIPTETSLTFISSVMVDMTPGIRRGVAKEILGRANARNLYQSTGRKSSYSNLRAIKPIATEIGETSLKS